MKQGYETYTKDEAKRRYEELCGRLGSLGLRECGEYDYLYKRVVLGQVAKAK